MTGGLPRVAEDEVGSRSSMPPRPSRRMALHLWQERVLPGRVFDRCFIGVALGVTIALSATAVANPKIDIMILLPLCGVVFTVLVWESRKSGSRRPKFDRGEWSRTGRWMWVGVRRSLKWLGFVVPRPSSRSPVWVRVAVWGVLLPSLLGLGLFLMWFAIGSLDPELFTVTDPEQIAARQQRRDQYLRGGILTALATAFIGAALAEEVIFRSVVLAVQRARPRNWVLLTGISLLTVVAFALVHSDFGTGNVVNAGVNAIAFTAIALYTRSLWPAIATHGVYNAIIMVGNYLTM